MALMLTPPVPTKKHGYGISLCQFGHMEAPEATLLWMGNWTAHDFLCFWRKEIDCLLDGTRIKAMILTGVYQTKEGLLFPGGCWEVYKTGDAFRVHQNPGGRLSDNTPQILPQDLWWTTMPDYKRGDVGENGEMQCFSEWVVQEDELIQWCWSCDRLLGYFEKVELDCSYLPDCLDDNVADYPGVRCTKDNGKRAFEVTIPKNQLTRSELFSVFSQAFAYPGYFAEDWGDFESFMDRAVWLPVHRLVFRHEDVPLAKDEQECATYLRILKEALTEWQDEKEKRFTVIFPLACRSAIKRIVSEQADSAEYKDIFGFQ